MEYTLATLKDTLTEGLDYLKNTFSSRFTLILPHDVVHHLNEVARSGLSRSEYIRSLIKADI